MDNQNQVISHNGWQVVFYTDLRDNIPLSLLKEVTSKIDEMIETYNSGKTYNLLVSTIKEGDLVYEITPEFQFQIARVRQLKKK